MPIIVLMYLFSSLDKSNLGNARTLGMMNDIGSDPTGSTYALLNSFYFIAYAPFSECLPSSDRARPDLSSGSVHFARQTTRGEDCDWMCRSTMGYLGDLFC